jgi:hypothetical protein
MCIGGRRCPVGRRTLANAVGPITGQTGREDRGQRPSRTVEGDGEMENVGRDEAGQLGPPETIDRPRGPGAHEVKWQQK